jgi:hypothetical protein
MIGQLKLDFWIENEVNVVFRGRHGVTLVDSCRPSRSKQAQALGI